MSSETPPPARSETPGSGRQDKARTLRVQILVLCIPLAAASLVLLYAHYRSSSPLWLWVGALVPAFLVMQHGVSLYLFRPTFFWRETPPASGATLSDLPHQTTPRDGGEPGAAAVSGAGSSGDRHGGRDTAAVRIRSLDQARVEAEQQFGLWSISLDYFVPTLLNVVAGLTMTYFAFVAFARPGFFLNDDAQDGVIMGSLGAFVYVLMALG